MSVPTEPTARAEVSAPGWYPDPLGHFPYRYWDGRTWSARAAWGGQVYEDLAMSGPAPEEVPHLEYLQAYLHGAIDRGVVRARDVQGLLDEVAAWERLPHLDAPAPWTRADAPAPSAPTPEPQQVALATQAPEPAPQAYVPARPTPAPTPPATAAGPSPARTWWRDTVRSVSADLAVHWFADLGALLLFVGIFGFVVFAFADVQVGLRPVAEALIPIALFGMGSVLRRRGTPAVGRVLQLAGGALLPVVLIAAFADGAAVPPDPSDAALSIVLTLTLLGVAAVYGLVTRRSPTSPLRFLIAPAVWLAVAAAALPLGREVPSGSDLVSPTAAQWSLVLVAIAATAVLSARRPREPWAHASLVASWPGLVIATVVTTTAAGVEGWPPVPLVVGAAAAVLTLEVLAQRWVIATTSVQTALGLVTAVLVARTWAPGWVTASVSVLAMLAAERRRRTTPDSVGTALVALGLAAWLVMLGWLGSSPWALVAASTLWWVWAVAMRRRAEQRWQSLETLAMWAMPVGAVSGVVAATSVPIAQLTLGALVALTAITLRLRPRWIDVHWAAWVPAFAAAGTTWLVATWPPTDLSAHLAAACMVIGFAAAPRHAVLRWWGTAVATTVLVGGLWVRLEGSGTTLALVACGSGVALVALGEARRRTIGGHLSAMGLLAAGASPWIAGLFTTGSQRATLPEVVTLSGLTLALTLVAAIEERRGSALGELTERVVDRVGSVLHATAGRHTVLVLRRLTLLVALPTAAITAVGWVDRTRWLASDSAWLGVVAVALMTAASLGARWVEPRHRPGAVLLALDATAVSVLAAPLAALAPGPRLATLLLLAAQPLLSGPRVRRAASVWIAWAAAALAVPATADLLGASAAWSGVSMLVAGGAAVVVTLVLRRRGRTLAVAPLSLGAVSATIGFGVTAAQGPTHAGWACLLAAVLVAAVAMLCAAPWASLGAWALGAGSVALLAPWDVAQLPWMWVPVTALLAAVATALQPRSADTSWTRRWDLPALTVAGGIAVLALGAAPGVGTDATVATWCGLGVVAIAVGLQRRWPVVGVLGAAVAVLGTAAAGPEWLAASLLAVTVAAAVATPRTRGATRTTAQLAAPIAASGSWLSTLVWLDRGLSWSCVLSAVAASSAVAGAGALALADEARRTRTTWLQVTVPALVLQGGALAVWSSQAGWPEPTGWWMTAAALVSAVGLGISARPTGWAWLRHAATGVALIAVCLLAVTTAPTATQASLALSFGALLGTAVWLVLGLVQRAGAWRAPVAVASGVLLGAGILLSRTDTGGAAVVALAVTAAAAFAVAASVPRGTTRAVAQTATALALLGAWHDVIVWREVPSPWWVAASAWAGGIGLLCGAAWWRLRRAGPDWVLTVVGSSAVLLVAATTARWAVTPSSDTTGFAVSAGFAMCAVAAAITTSPTRRMWWRVLSTVSAWWAAGVLVDTLALSDRQMVTLCATAALLATAAVVVAARTDRLTGWIPPLEVSALVGTALVWILVDLRSPTPVAVALLLTGIEMAAVGAARRVRPLLLAAPWVILAAWGVLSISALEGEPVWLTVPMGATVLITVGLERSMRRREGRELSPRHWALLEYLGIAVMAATPLLEAASTEVLRAVVATAIGVLVAGWGVLTRVRHRLAAGLVVVALSLLVLVVVPMVDVGRRLQGAEIWLALAGIGVVSIVLATLLERGRRVATQSWQRLHELTGDWQ